MARVTDITEDRSFRPPNSDYVPGKVMRPEHKYGMSKDSPFHNAYTQDHPLTKQLLGYGEKRRSTDLNTVKHPKMFLNIMR